MSFARPLLLSSLAVVAASAHAQSFDAVTFQGTPETTTGGRAGVAIVHSPRYLGADESRLSGLPFVDYRWSNGFFIGLASGAGYRWTSPDKTVQAGVRLSYDFGRKEDKSAALAGLGDIDGSPEAGAFFSASLGGGFSFRTALRYGSGNEHDGMIVDTGLGWGTQIAPRLRLGFNLSATWANQDYMQAYFGITPEQSVRSGYAPYQVEAGLRDVRAGVSLAYFINREWAVIGGVTMMQLQGDAKDSPIVRDDTAVSGVVAVTYSF
jgi:outer membrane scaffolding protein for murein synthesis (MipA/OmpV family)